MNWTAFRARFPEMSVRAITLAFLCKPGTWDQAEYDKLCKLVRRSLRVKESIPAKGLDRRQVYLRIGAPVPSGHYCSVLNEAFCVFEYFCVCVFKCLCVCVFVFEYLCVRVILRRNAAPANFQLLQQFMMSSNLVCGWGYSSVESLSVKAPFECN